MTTKASIAAVWMVWAPAVWLPLLAPRPAESRIGNQVTELDERSFDDFVRKNDKAVVDFYRADDPNWHTLKGELDNAFRQTRDFGSNVPIGKVNVDAHENLMKKYAPNGPFPQLMWFQHGEATQYHRSLRKAKNIMDFVLALDRDPVQAFESEEEVRKSVNRAVWAQVPKGSAAYKVVEIVAQKHMDTTEFAFKDNRLNEIRWISEDSQDSPLFEGEVTVDGLEKWVRSHLTKSEPLPEPQEGDSVPVVGTTFEDVVLQPEKDVFLLIFAPWCGFSRKMLPTWESLARRASAIPHLVVSKMDGDRNGSPYPEDFSWNAYPTVFFVKAGIRKPFVYHGNRTEASLLDFARKHGSRSVADEISTLLERQNGSMEGIPADAEWEL